MPPPPSPFDFDPDKIFSKRKGRPNLDEVYLNDHELRVLNILTNLGGTATAVELLRGMRVPVEYDLINGMIDFMTKLEGKGIVRRINSSPVKWSITFRGRESI